MRNYLGCAFLLLFLFVGDAAIGQSNKQKVIIELNDLFTYLHDHKMFNGGVGVRYKGEVIFKKGYGTGNFDKGTPFTPSSQTEIGSLSKQFTATAIMILWKNGKLQLTDNMNKFFSPALPYEGITVKDLLTHQSGLPRYTPLFRKDDWDIKKIATNEDIVKLVRKFHPEPFFKPGTNYRYSNLGYILLAQIVKHVSGKDLNQFLNEHIFLPFGMSSTGFYSRDKIFKMPLYAPGVIWNKDSGRYTRPERMKRRQYVWYLSGRFGSGRLTSSVNDLLTWDSLLYTDAFLPQAIIHKMFEPEVNAPSKNGYSYGLGWYVKNDDPSIVYHTGSWAGNRTYIKRFTKEKTAIILLDNTYDKLGRIRRAVDNIVQGRPWSYPEKKK